MPFSGLAPSKLNFKKIRVCFVYIEESFNTIFNMGYGGRTTGKSPMDDRVKKESIFQFSEGGKKLPQGDFRQEGAGGYK